MKKRAKIAVQVKRYLTKVLDMDTLQDLGVIGAFILMHVVAIIILGAILIALDYDATPIQFKPSVLTMNNVKRTKSGDLAFYHTHTETGEQYYRVGIQWKHAKTHKIVSKKSIGL